MIIYKAELRYESLRTQKNDKETLNPAIDDKRICRIINDANDGLGVRCGLDDNLSVAAVNGEYGHWEMVFACNLEKVTLKDCEKWIKNHFLDNYAVKNVAVENIREISAKEFNKLLDKANDRDFYSGWNIANKLGLDYLENRRFQVQERVYEQEDITKRKLKSFADDIMADKSLLEEIDRIYSSQNEKKYYGNPVHYVITAGTVQAANDIISLLVFALKANNRLLGGRVSYVNKISEHCSGDEDFQQMFELGRGSAVAIDMSGTDEDHGVYASAYREVVDFIAKTVVDNQMYTLCFFVQLSENPGFSKGLIAAVQDDIHLIEICEGRGDKEQAVNYLEKLTKKSQFKASRGELEKALPTKTKTFTATEVYKTYNKWFSNGLKSKAYKAYKSVEKVAVREKKKENKPYEELQNMVGLADIKALVDQIINTAKIRQSRSKLGLDNYKVSQHMIFTGNPGSAKTTIARLMAEILKQEGVLETGHFVECGRADLVGKYVGWTAQIVQKKFREAKGGILFIDEAYALVDNYTNSFGAEAINTIVQEMENRRDDVIVIFAGYPDRMEQFLAENEGLRSRIAFHLDFPDYNAEEMLQILELMVKNKGYEINDEVREKCLDIFKCACGQSEFGNGRFARNLLEQAMMKQSDRLIKESNGKKISRKDLTSLMADDFSVNAEKMYKKPKTAIGFV
ncbi:stage V sporulation protein K [Anaerovibrio sp. JC8]|uniref:AAA family ATPase n=1 Tax=Anaerovibrio sp. JC8 TaxID=1240085 RepID=UPI000A0DBE57|nr:AAA family ATPase [Anaerovibrio sp. JC8]ORU00169.1 stage V sporulation protein K [Anaerovibrio sp. JC8]